MFVPNIRPNQIRPPSREIYDAMGEENIFKMLADFYAALEQSSIRDMFPSNMPKASEKSAAFFVGLLGGPPLYHQRYGNPMMRGRHMPFRITESARLVWLGCFLDILEDAQTKYQFPMEHMGSFLQFLDGFSKWMVNTADDNTE
ncbi:MAG: hypothetical protein AAF490_17185 [Chloroflexota bacterium]